MESCNEYRNDPKFSDRQVWAKEQSDQGLHCLPLCLHLLDALFYGKTTLFKPTPVAQSVECLLRGTEGNAFDPGP